MPPDDGVVVVGPERPPLRCDAVPVCDSSRCAGIRLLLDRSVVDDAPDVPLEVSPDPDAPVDPFCSVLAAPLPSRDDPVEFIPVDPVEPVALTPALPADVESSAVPELPVDVASTLVPAAPAADVPSPDPPVAPGPMVGCVSALFAGWPDSVSDEPLDGVVLLDELDGALLLDEPDGELVLPDELDEGVRLEPLIALDEPVPLWP